MHKALPRPLPVCTGRPGLQVENELANTSAPLVNWYGATLTAAVNATLLGASPAHGVFLDSCYHHCGGYNSITIGGETQASAFARWYRTSGRPLRAWAQNAVYPCAACCSP